MRVPFPRNAGLQGVVIQPDQPEDLVMAKIKEGDTVVIEATVSLVSKDGSEVTIRIPHYGYPVTVPVNSVAAVKAAAPAPVREAEPLDAVERKPRGRSKLAKVLDD